MIKYLVWDVDNTLYSPSPEAKKLFENLYNKLIENSKASSENFLSLFKKRKERYKSSLMTLASLSLGSLKELANHFDEQLAEKLPIKEDPKLIEMFKELKDYQHYVLRNGTLKGTFKILEKLGLGKIKWKGCEFGPFKKVWATVDSIGVPKPHPIVFDYVRTYLFLIEMGRFPKDEKELFVFASKILMIGDRQEVDLKPAKELGFKTFLVKEKGVFEVAEILKN